MTTSEVIGTYARVLFDLASAADAVDAADEGLRTVVDAVRGSMELREVLADAAIPGDKKREILRDLFADVASPEAVAVATLVVERGAAKSLGDVYRSFGEIAETERGIVVA
ncbi:MAG: F0F1 ATP synthase subunit delta, partial [Coriobacteriia bacterium]|nr:F0F1 ATP synthase subunit delta [Coriobacteriia bacterium]